MSGHSSRAHPGVSNMDLKSQYKTACEGTMWGQWTWGFFKRTKETNTLVIPVLS